MIRMNTRSCRAKVKCSEFTENQSKFGVACENNNA